MENSGQENEKQLKELHSYRIEVDFDDVVEVRLRSGRAEIFGAELSPFITYTFTGTKVALFTWHGCTFTIKGKTLKEYDWDESRGQVCTSLSYVNIHTYLNQQRELALINEKTGPRVLVTGSNSSGKTTLCKILLNYAVKTGWKPIFSDLDVSNNELFTQSTMGASVIDTYYPENFFEHPSLIYFFGHPDIGSHVQLYQEQVQRLGINVNAKLDEDLRKAKNELFNHENLDKENLAHQEKMTCFSGIIVNMGQWSQNMSEDPEKKREILAAVVSAFQIDTVIVIDDQGLFRTLEEIDEKRNMVIESLAKNGAVVQIDDKHKKDRIFRKFRGYFYGLGYDIMRHTVELPFSKFRLYKVGTLSDDVLPAYSAAGLNTMIAAKVDCKKLKIKKIIGALNLQKSENEEPTLDEIVSASLSYLVLITEISVEKGTISFVFPGPDEFKWTNTICLDSEIYSNIK